MPQPPQMIPSSPTKLFSLSPNSTLAPPGSRSSPGLVPAGSRTAAFTALRVVGCFRAARCSSRQRHAVGLSCRGICLSSTPHCTVLAHTKGTARCSVLRIHLTSDRNANRLGLWNLCFSTQLQRVKNKQEGVTKGGLTWSIIC